jgi:hypothetical protein
VLKAKAHDPDVVDRKLFQHHAPLPGGREFVSGCPVPGDVLRAPVEITGLEGFEVYRGVTKVIEPQFVEVVLSNPDIEIPSPIVVDALVYHGAAGIEAFQAVGAGSERRLQRRVADLPPDPGLIGRLPPVFWQHRKLPNDLREFAVTCSVERKRDFSRACHLGAHDMAIVGRKSRVVLLECIKGKDHVLGCYWHAIMPFGRRPQSVRHRTEVRRMADGLGKQAVFGRHFVERRRQQCLVDELDSAGEDALHSVHCHVEIIKRAGDAPSHRAGFRRLRVDVVKVREMERIF